MIPRPQEGGSTCISIYEWKVFDAVRKILRYSRILIDFHVFLAPFFHPHITPFSSTTHIKEKTCFLKAILRHDILPSSRSGSQVGYTEVSMIPSIRISRAVPANTPSKHRTLNRALRQIEARGLNTTSTYVVHVVAGRFMYQETHKILFVQCSRACWHPLQKGC